MVLKLKIGIINNTIGIILSICEVTRYIFKTSQHNDLISIVIIHVCKKIFI